MFAILVFVAAFALRIYHLGLPFVEPYNNITRQSVVAMIVRNFYRHGFRFFYPETDLNGNGPSLFAAEMPIYSYLMAIAYKLSGGVHEWAARAVSVLASMGMLFFLYLLIKKLAGRKRALIAVLFAALSPIHLALSRSIQAEATMLFASVGALYTIYAYFDTKKIAYYFSSCFLLWLAIVSKAHALYLCLPIAFIAWHYRGRALFKDPKSYAYAAVILIALAWYAYMYRLSSTGQLVYSGTLRYGQGDAYSDITRLFQARYFISSLKIFFIHVLTPAGTVLFLAGLRGRKEFADRFFLVWLFGVLVYMVIFWPTFIDHSYYQLPFVPPLAYFVAKGSEGIAGFLRKNRVMGRIGIAVLAGTTLLGLAYLYRGLYFIPKEAMAIVQAGSAVDSLTEKDSLVVVTGGTPALLYYSVRKGWEFYPSEQGAAELEGLRNKGAGYLVVMTRRPLGDRAAWFDPYLRSHYRVVSENVDYALFDLKRPLFN